MTRDQALAKIKKCLALAASSNPHEAATAMRQAQKLMAEHNLTEMEISLANVSEAATDSVTADLVQWEVNLVDLVARAFGCEHYTKLNYLPTPLAMRSSFKRQRQYIFMGVGAAPQVASYAYEVLSRQCARDRLAYIKAQSKNCKPKTKTARGDMFARGWVLGVAAKVERFSGSERNDALVAQYKQKKGLKEASVRDRTVGKNITHNDFGKGMQAGEKAQLDRGIGGREAQGVLCQ